MHQNERQLAAPGNFGDARITLKRCHVVDDFCAGFGCSLRDFGFVRINRNWNFEAAAKHVQYRDYSS